MHSELKNIKISSNLKDKIKKEYKIEKEKPKYKFRKILNYEIEIPKVFAIAIILIITTAPVVDTVNKVKDLTENKIEVRGENIETNKKSIKGELHKNKN